MPFDPRDLTIDTDPFRMLNGQILTRETLTAAGIAQTDISASNGVMHVINSVLMP